MLLHISKLWKMDGLKIVERWEPNKPDDPSNKFSKILNMGSISSREHDMEFWQYGIIETSKKLRNHETLKPRN